MERRCLREGTVITWTKGSLCGLLLVRRNSPDGEDFGGGLALGGTLLSGLGGFLVPQFRPCCRTSAKGASPTMTEAVGMFILQDLDAAAQEAVLPLSIEERDGNVMIHLPRARSCSSGGGSSLARRHTTIN